MYSKDEYVVVLSIDEVGIIVWVDTHAMYLSYDVRLLDGTIIMCGDEDIRSLNATFPISELDTIMNELDELFAIPK